MSESLNKAHDRLVAWLVDSALPLWSQRGIDKQSGFVYDYLHPDGTPDTSAHHNLAVQAKQIYALSRAEEMRWISGLQADITYMAAKAGLLGASPCRSDGFVHRLDSDLNIADGHYHVADHARFMMSSAATGHAFREGTEMRRAYNIFEWLERKYRHPAGDWKEGSANTQSLHLSTQIRLGEAFIYIYECSRKPKWLDCAAEFWRLFSRQIYSGEIDSLAECRLQDWRPDPQEGSLIPEDLNALVVLLGRMSGLLDAAGIGEAATAIYRQALEVGYDESTGLLYSRVSPRGEPIDAAKPCAALLQFILANLIQIERGDQSAIALVEPSIDRLFEYYLDKGVAGTVVRTLDAKAQPVDERSYAGTLSEIVEVAIALNRLIRVAK